ncbi:hypothetical protein NDU88_009912 [Pleurodeles waltl]|uniref:Uncharacterized protein n=1 Tax=Pleurodeles waltl TaxID=8319 RepID=A0AAV7RXM2_PLEWA|nr:hypothetical protein NDU88_009912 [Pleurodeles waltl]
MKRGRMQKKENVTWSAYTTEGWYHNPQMTYYRCYPDHTAGTLQEGKIHRGAGEDSICLHLEKVLPAIVDTKQTLQQDISAVSVGLGLLRSEHHKLAEMVRTVEATVGEIKPDKAEFACGLVDLTETVKVLEHRAKDADG